jgi:peptidoglycan/LPS O-acetylase OafA/YrhL
MTETTTPRDEPSGQPGGDGGQSAGRATVSRLAWLDALRGFAALCVVFDHGSTLLLLPARNYLYHWLNLGQYGVFVFFLVSGYIVPASLERRGSLRGFWISRAFRLYPMFVLAVGLSLLAGELGYGTYFGVAPHPLAAGLSWLFMLQNVNGGLNVPVVTWTLSYEMIFYLLLAALFSWGVHRRSGWYAAAFAAGAVALGGILPMAALDHWRGSGDAPLVVTGVTDGLIAAGLALCLLSRSWTARAGASLAALTALVLMMVNQNYPFPWSGCTILALMFCGTLIYRAERQQVSRLVAAAVVTGVLLVVTLAGDWHGAQLHYDAHWQLQWATSVLLAGATFGLGLAAQRLRVPRWCAWLGMISYSVYLLHTTVFDVYRKIPVLHRPHTMLTQVLLAAALLAVIVALSGATYYLVEKPMQRLGHRVARRVGEPGNGSAARPGPGTAARAGNGTAAAFSDETAASGNDAAPSGDSAAARGGAAPDAAASRSASSNTAVAGGSGGSP